MCKPKESAKSEMFFKWSAHTVNIFQLHLQFFSVNTCHVVRDKLYDELIQVSEALNEVEKVLRLPQLEPYRRNYGDLC